jgi:hypothetical protein
MSDEAATATTTVTTMLHNDDGTIVLINRTVEIHDGTHRPLDGSDTSEEDDSKEPEGVSEGESEEESEDDSKEPEEESEGESEEESEDDSKEPEEESEEESEGESEEPDRDIKKQITKCKARIKSGLKTLIFREQFTCEYIRDLMHDKHHYQQLKSSLSSHKEEQAALVAKYTAMLNTACKSIYTYRTVIKIMENEYHIYTTAIKKEIAIAKSLLLVAGAGLHYKLLKCDYAAIIANKIKSDASANLYSFDILTHLDNTFELYNYRIVNIEQMTTYATRRNVTNIINKYLPHGFIMQRNTKHDDYVVLWAPGARYP